MDKDIVHLDSPITARELLNILYEVSGINLRVPMGHVRQPSRIVTHKGKRRPGRSLKRT